jgi:hypothetical protein
LGLRSKRWLRRSGGGLARAGADGRRVARKSG